MLAPVAILVEGRFYDAELYHAQPEPLAVDSGVVYDVFKNGDPIGTFTVGGARQHEGAWYGLGSFEPKTQKPAESAKSSSPASLQRAPDAEEDRPRLRRGPAPPVAPKQETDAVLNNIDRDPERPTLRRHSADERKVQAVRQSNRLTHTMLASCTESFLKNPRPEYHPSRRCVKSGVGVH